MPQKEGVGHTMALVLGLGVAAFDAAFAALGSFGGMVGGVAYVLIGLMLARGMSFGSLGGIGKTLIGLGILLTGLAKFGFAIFPGTTLIAFGIVGILLDIGLKGGFKLPKIG
jgi:hypothetical protein